MASIDYRDIHLIESSGYQSSLPLRRSRSVLVSLRALVVNRLKSMNLACGKSDSILLRFLYENRQACLRDLGCLSGVGLCVDQTKGQWSLSAHLGNDQGDLTKCRWCSVSRSLRGTDLGARMPDVS